MLDQPVTIPELLALREGSDRGMVFLDDSGEYESWTYGALAAVARRCAGAWQDVGVGPGDRVGLLGSTTPDLVAAIFGCWAAGAIAVPLAVPLRLASTEGLLEEVRVRADKAQIGALAIDPRFEAFPELFALGPRTVKLDELRGMGREVPFAQPNLDDGALIQFTSGSTANPKGAVLSHRGLIGNGMAVQRHERITRDDVAVSWLPLYHDFGLIGLTLWPVLLDIWTYLMSPETFIASPRRWIEALSRYGGTITAAPNFAYGLAARALRRSESLDLSPLRLAANGAEPVDPDTVREFGEAAAEHGFRPEALVAVYGLAEATLGVAAPPPLAQPQPWWVDAEALAERGIAVEAEPEAQGARPLVSVGDPLPGVEVEIRHPQSSERLPDGQVGEVWVRSDYAMLGYWDEPEQTAEAIVDGWVRTGDLGLVGPNGLVITGRLKDMIIVAGRNLYPEDAERVVQQVPGVRRGNTVAFGILGRAREGLVVVAETRASGEEATHLAKRISVEVRNALRIATDQVVLLTPGTLPKTPSGKLQRRVTKRLYEAGQLVGAAVPTTGRRLGGDTSPEPA